MLAKRYNVVQMRQFFSSKSCVRLLSLPMRGEWIEMGVVSSTQRVSTSLPMRGEWIEISHKGYDYNSTTSLPMRGEWIEIGNYPGQLCRRAVSPHAGRVD